MYSFNLYLLYTNTIKFEINVENDAAYIPNFGINIMFITMLIIAAATVVYPIILVFLYAVNIPP